MSWNTKKAIQELVRGKELTKQLRDLLTKSLTDDGSVNSEDLVLKICNTFANSLSFLTNSNTTTTTTTTAVADFYYNDDLNGVSQKPTINITSDGRKSEDSGDSIKSPPSTLRDRRGSYKRRYLFFFLIISYFNIFFHIFFFNIIQKKKMHLSL